MSDLINRANAIEAWEKLSKRGRTEFDQVLMTLPSTNVVKGEWIYDHHNDEHTCSVCGRKALCDDYFGITDLQMEVLSNYCPSCGARMKGGDTK